MSAPVPLDWGEKSALLVARFLGSWNGFGVSVRPGEDGGSGLEDMLGEGFKASGGEVRRRRCWTGGPIPSVTPRDCSAAKRVAGWAMEAGERGVSSSVNMLTE